MAGKFFCVHAWRKMRAATSAVCGTGVAVEGGGGVNSGMAVSGVPLSQASSAMATPLNARIFKKARRDRSRMVESYISWDVQKSGAGESARGIIAETRGEANKRPEVLCAPQNGARNPSGLLVYLWVTTRVAVATKGQP